MATFWLTQLVIVTLNIFLVVLFVAANKDFCGSVFETQLDHALVGHAMGTAVVVDEFECQLKCLGNNSCKSFNTHPYGNSAKRLKCELNSKTRQMKPGDFKWRKGSTYYGSVQVSCIDVFRDENGPTKRVCRPVGVANRNIIPDTRMTASTTYPKDLPHYGRLNGRRSNGVWCTKAKQIKEDYLQVDMGAVHSVCALATQGPRNEVYTTSYKLQLSTDGVTWNFYNENNVEKVFQTDRTGIVQHSLINNAKGRFVRFYPVTYNTWPCLAVEIFVLA